MQRVSEQPRGSGREAAVDRAADQAYRSLRLSSDQFPGQEARFIALQTDVITAAQVIAAGDKVPLESRQVLLRPFAEAGIEAAGEALRTVGETS